MQINEIGKEMVTQNNRMTQFPLFVVYSKVERAVPDGWGESRRKDFDGLDLDDLCENCAELHEDGKDLPDYCENCDSDCFWNCREELEPDLTAGVFFTAKACQEHIDENKYHYTDPIVYGISAWRNEEMQMVQRHLIELSGEKVPSHYK